MGQSPGQIRDEIEQKRTDAASKIDQLQNQFESSVNDVRTQAQDMAGDMRDQVKGAVDDTVDTVKQNLDVRQQIEERPLIALGVAFFGGFMLGSMSGGDHHQSNQVNQSQNGRQQSSMSTGIRSAIQQSGLDETLSNAAAALVGSMTDQLKGTLDRNFPGFAAKMNTAQREEGDFAEKMHATQSAEFVH